MAKFVFMLSYIFPHAVFSLLLHMKIYKVLDVCLALPHAISDCLSGEGSAVW